MKLITLIILCCLLSSFGSSYFFEDEEIPLSESGVVASPTSSTTPSTSTTVAVTSTTTATTSSTSTTVSSPTTTVSESHYPIPSGGGEDVPAQKYVLVQPIVGSVSVGSNQVSDADVLATSGGVAVIGAIGKAAIGFIRGILNGT